MSFTTFFGIEKPDQGTLRFDIAINENFDRMDDGFRCWASGYEPSDANNYPDITLTEGVLWRDTTNHLLKVRGSSSWEDILACSAVTEMNASGSTDLSTWADLIDAGNAADPRYVIPYKVGGTTYYIPCFTAL